MLELLNLGKGATVSKEMFFNPPVATWMSPTRKSSTCSFAN